jgi:hypothetical protein
MLRRQAAGGRPTTSRNTRVKWAWSAKPGHGDLVERDAGVAEERPGAPDAGLHVQRWGGTPVASLKARLK